MVETLQLSADPGKGGLEVDGGLLGPRGARDREELRADNRHQQRPAPGRHHTDPGMGVKAGSARAALAEIDSDVVAPETGIGNRYHDLRKLAKYTETAEPDSRIAAVPPSGPQDQRRQPVGRTAG